MKKLRYVLTASLIFLALATSAHAEEVVKRVDYPQDVSGQEGRLWYIDPASPGRRENDDVIWVRLNVPEEVRNSGEGRVKGIRLTIHDHDEGGKFQIFGLLNGQPVWLNENGNPNNLIPGKVCDSCDVKWPEEDIDTLGNDFLCGTTGGKTPRIHPDHAGSNPDHEGCLSSHPVLSGSEATEVPGDRLITVGSNTFYSLVSSAHNQAPGCNAEGCIIDQIDIKLKWNHTSDKLPNMHYHIGAVEWLYEGTPPGPSDLVCTTDCVNRDFPNQLDNKIHLNWQGGTGYGMVVNIAPGMSPNWSSSNGLFWNKTGANNNVYSVIRSQFSPQGIATGPLILQPDNVYSTYVHDPTAGANTNIALCDLQWCEGPPDGGDLQCNDTCQTNADCTDDLGRGYICYDDPNEPGPRRSCRLADNPATTRIESNSASCDPSGGGGGENPGCDEACNSTDQCQIENQNYTCSESYGNVCRLITNPSSPECLENATEPDLDAGFAAWCSPPRPQDPPLSYRYTVAFNKEDLDNCNLRFSDIFFGFTEGPLNTPIREFLGEPALPDYPINGDGWYGYKIESIGSMSAFTLVTNENGVEEYVRTGYLNNSDRIGPNNRTIQQLYDFINAQIDAGNPVLDVIDLGASLACNNPGIGTNWITPHNGKLYLNDAHPRRCPGDLPEEGGAQISGEFRLTTGACTEADSTPVNPGSPAVTINPSIPGEDITANATSFRARFPSAVQNVRPIVHFNNTNYECASCNDDVVPAGLRLPGYSNSCIGPEVDSPTDNAHIYLVSASAVLPVDPWWQTWGGLVYGHNNILSRIPVPGVADDCEDDASCDPHLITNAPGGPDQSAGIPATRLSNIVPRTGLGSIMGWLTANPGNPHALEADMKVNLTVEDFDYFAGQVDLNGVQAITSGSIGSVNISSGTLRGTGAGAARVFHRSGDLIFRPSSTWNVGSNKVIIFVSGNLTFEEAGPEQLINVGPGGFLAFIVSGDVTIASSVGNADVTNTDSNIESVVVANGDLITEAGSERLVLEGSYVGWRNIRLNRAVDGISSRVTPSEVVIHRPDFVTNAPDVIRASTLNWREIN